MCTKGLKQKSGEEARNSLAKLCAKSEKSSGDAVRLMTKWGVSKEEQRIVLDELINMGFIDDARYATLFIREKSRLNGWGSFKIAAALRAKGVAREVIEEKLAEYEDHDTICERLVLTLTKRSSRVKHETLQELRHKLIAYGASLGHNFQITTEATEIVINKLKEESDHD